MTLVGKELNRDNCIQNIFLWGILLVLQWQIMFYGSLMLYCKTEFATIEPTIYLLIPP